MEYIDIEQLNYQQNMKRAENVVNTHSVFSFSFSLGFMNTYLSRN